MEISVNLVRLLPSCHLGEQGNPIDHHMHPCFKYHSLRHRPQPTISVPLFVMASAVLSSVLHLIDNFDQPSLNPCKTIQQCLDHLKPTLLSILSLLPDAELRETLDEAVQHWLRDLRAAVYDAEDILEDYKFQLLSQSKVTHPTHLTLEGSIAASIKGFIERLGSIASQSAALHLNKFDRERVDLRPPTLPVVSKGDEIVVYGRENDRKRVTELLMLDQRSNLSVVSLVGVRGVGKTTLAELVYNDSLTCQHFDVRGWVCVSEDFNLVRLMKAIVASVDAMPCIYAEFNHLQNSMMHVLQGKKFLLVLDDVWNEDQSLWETLRASLTFGLEGSVVLVTTRSESVAKIMQTIPFYHVDCLSEDDCWLLFQHCVFDSSRDASATLNLVAIGEGIVKKFNGLPLAAKMVGRLLTYETNEQIWHTILHSDHWDSNNGTLDAILPAIIICYYSLPAYLKRCFMYCALFPKDYLFKKEALVRLWMAEGFIRSVEGKRIEDEGIEYFDELLRRSFFQYSQIDTDTFLCSAHDLASSVSRYEICSMQDENLCSVTSEVRHLSLVPSDFMAERRIQFSDEPAPWRTFLVIHRLLSTCNVNFLVKANRLQLRFPINIFIKFGCLRTLDLSETKITSLTDSIGDLKHLRYLGLHHTRIEILPESLSNLYNLQTLVLSDCDNLSELPKGTKNLTHLRHLYLPRFVAIIPMPRGIGMLTDLQTLSTFHVGRNSEHCVITELKDLVNLRGEIDIGGLENVSNIEDAKGALEGKEYLAKLILRSGSRCDFVDLSNFDFSLFDSEVVETEPSQLFGDKSSRDEIADACTSNLVDGGIQEETTKQLINVSAEEAEELEEHLFEYLRPHKNLCEIEIHNHHSTRFPSWLGDPYFSNLVSVKLDSCSNCSVLPPLGQLKSLRYLVIEQLSMLENIGNEFCSRDPTININGFPALETLHFGSMYKWEEWSGTGDCDFPRLRLLDLNYCPKLRRLPDILSSLEKLAMRFWFCPELTVLPTVPSLTSLEILGHCDSKMLFSISEESLTRLQSLKIHGFNDLTSLPLHNLFALKDLEISNCQESPSTSPSLGTHLSNLSSLKQMKLEHCHGLWLAPEQQFPSTLQRLDIDQCPLLTEWCQGHGSSRLAHIPRVILDKKDFHPVDKPDAHNIR